MASLFERQEIAKGKAKELMISLDWEVLVKAIAARESVWFKYIDRNGVFTQRRAEYPHSFFETPAAFGWEGKVWLWSEHKVHRKREQYDVRYIIDVHFFPTPLENTLDPAAFDYSWYGEGALFGSTVL